MISLSKGNSKDRESTNSIVIPIWQCKKQNKTQGMFFELMLFSMKDPERTRGNCAVVFHPFMCRLQHMWGRRASGSTTVMCGPARKQDTQQSVPADWECGIAFSLADSLNMRGESHGTLSFWGQTAFTMIMFSQQTMIVFKSNWHLVLGALWDIVLKGKEILLTRQVVKFT